MHRSKVLILASLVASALTTSAGAASFSFTPLGAGPGEGLDDWQSAAWEISADGAVVVGASGDVAFRWTAGGGMVGLSSWPFWDAIETANAASANGSVVVGTGRSHDHSFINHEAFRWTSLGTIEWLGDLPGGTSKSAAEGVSADGSIVVGTSNSAATKATYSGEAFRWTSLSGMVGLGDLPGGEFDSAAFAVSADGSVVVGQSRSESGVEAFRWTSGGGMVGLGDLPGGAFFSSAGSVSADGSVVVGRSTSAAGVEIFRWTPGGGIVGLGLPLWGDIVCSAHAVSADGAVIVGSSNDGNIYAAPPTPPANAIIWTASDGLIRVQDVLTNHGVSNLDGWKLYSAEGVSADGKTIVGYGRNPDGYIEAWIATVPEPSTLVLALCGAAGLALCGWRKRGQARPTISAQ